jgi:23S rRNA-/tRNA-specific pseudouridylate synthase
MAKPKEIELEEAGIRIPILYEDRSVLALDKPPGWMLAPDWWDRTGRNLHLALQSSLSAGDFWARSRNLKFLRFIHRLDSDTSGVMLFAKSAGALSAYSELFENRLIEKQYLAVVRGVPKEKEWTCRLAVAPDPAARGRMRVAKREHGSAPERGSRREASERGEDSDEERARRGASGDWKDAETRFRVLQAGTNSALVLAEPLTGRTHQIRVHLAAAGYPVAGDELYGGLPPAVVKHSNQSKRLALRSVRLAYRDPFQNRRVVIEAPAAGFLKEHGFNEKEADSQLASPRTTGIHRATSAEQISQVIKSTIGNHGRKMKKSS